MTTLQIALRPNTIQQKREHNDIANLFVNPAQKQAWRVEAIFTCPLVGFCLTPVEQRRLLKQASINAEKFDAFVIHELLVNGLQSDSPFSQRILRFFERKFERDYAYARKLDDGAFLEEWRKAFESGHYAGLIWVAATRFDLAVQTKTKVYGDVHMSMHGTADAQIQAQQRLDQAERSAERFRLRIAALRDDLAAQKQKLDAEVSQHRIAQAEIARLRYQVQRLEESGVTKSCAMSQTWSLRGPLLEKENEALHLALSHAAEREARLQEQLASQLKDWQEYAESAAATMNEVSAEIAESCPLTHSDGEVCHKTCCRAICHGESCADSENCARRVLIVGGIERMESLYRELVERNGGILEYHHGGTRSGLQGLKKSLQRADVVLCMVNCNSHSACIKVKDFAKKYRKRLHMLHNGSLSTVSRVLESQIQ